VLVSGFLGESEWKMVDSMLTETWGLLGGGQKVYGVGSCDCGGWTRECYLIVWFIASLGIKRKIVFVCSANWMHERRGQIEHGRVSYIEKKSYLLKTLTNQPQNGHAKVVHTHRSDIISMLSPTI
jgi:hypothetical protein